MGQLMDHILRVKCMLSRCLDHMVVVKGMIRHFLDHMVEVKGMLGQWLDRSLVNQIKLGTKRMLTQQKLMQ